MNRCHHVMWDPLSFSRLSDNSNFNPLKPGYMSKKDVLQILLNGGVHKMQARAQVAGSCAALFWGRCKLFAQHDEGFLC